MRPASIHPAVSAPAKAFVFLLGLAMVFASCGRPQQDAAAPASPASPFEIAPGGVGAMLRIASLDRLDAGVGGFLQASLGMEFPGMVEGVLFDELNQESKDAVDRVRPLWILSHKTGGKVTLAALVPVIDGERFLHGTETRAAEDEKIRKKKINYDVIDGYAIVSRSDSVEPIQQWTASGAPAALAKFKAEGDATLWLKSDEVKNNIQIELDDYWKDQAENPDPDPHPFAASPLTKMKWRWMLDLLGQTREIEIQAFASSEGVRIHGRAAVADDTPMRTFVDSWTAAPDSDTRPALCEHPLAKGYVNFPGEFFQLVKDRLAADMTSMAVDGGAFANTWAMIGQAFEARRATWVEVAQDGALTFTASAPIRERAAAEKFIETFVGEWKGWVDAALSPTEFEAQIVNTPNAGEADGDAYSTVEVRLRTRDPESPYAREMEPYHATVEYGLTSDMLIVTSGSFERARTQFRLGDTEPFWPDKQALGELAELDVNLAQVVNWMKKRMTDKMPMLNLLAMVHIPEDAPMRGASVVASVTGHGLEADFHLPAEDIKTLWTMFSGSPLGGMK
ncbi:MAG: hypothetical protein GC154_08330 [bacterium]|nr:hypothetical protein [bacterium]